MVQFSTHTSSSTLVESGENKKVRDRDKKAGLVRLSNSAACPGTIPSRSTRPHLGWTAPARLSASILHSFLSSQPHISFSSIITDSPLCTVVQYEHILKRQWPKREPLAAVWTHNSSHRNMSALPLWN